MNITAETVKQLRERTGAGFMECKKALVETKGDLDAAAELMRKQGLAKADRKAARVAAEGVIVSGARIGAYVHGTRIGAVVAVEGGDAPLAHDLAMHVAASSPRYLTVADVPADVLAKEREILTEQAQGEGKPPEIVAKMVEGRLRKSLGEITLTGQAFVKDPDVSIEKLLKGARASVTAFERFEVGVGIEKKQGDFVAEVMAQVKSSTGGGTKH